MTSTEDRLKALMAEHLDLDQDLDRDAKLAEAGVSSVDAVAFLKVVTQEFKVAIPPGDYSGLQTVGDLVRYLDNNAEPVGHRHLNFCRHLLLRCASRSS